MNRRKLLKSIGISIGGTLISTKVLARLANDSFEYEIPPNPLHKMMGKPVTAITLGAGNRGMVYGGFAAEYPAELKIVGVAEPIKFRNDRYAKIHAIPDGNRFVTWEHVFQKPKFADAIIISTPDRRVSMMDVVTHYTEVRCSIRYGWWYRGWTV